ncbi:MAG: hypothetical protein AAB728_00880 [Patescibacteria group bacterium]
MHAEKPDFVEACLRKIERAEAQHPEHWEAAVEEARERFGSLLSTGGAAGNCPELVRLSDAIRKYSETELRTIGVAPGGQFHHAYSFIGKIRNAKKQSREQWEAAVVEASQYFGDIFFGDTADGVPPALKLLEAEIQEYYDWEEYT